MRVCLLPVAHPKPSGGGRGAGAEGLARQGVLRSLDRAGPSDRTEWQADGSASGQPHGKGRALCRLWLLSVGLAGVQLRPARAWSCFKSTAARYHPLCALCLCLCALCLCLCALCLCALCLSLCSVLAAEPNPPAPSRVPMQCGPLYAAPAGLALVRGVPQLLADLAQVAPGQRLGQQVACAGRGVWLQMP